MESTKILKKYSQYFKQKGFLVLGAASPGKDV